MGFVQVDKPNLSAWIGIQNGPALRVWLALVQRADKGNRVIISEPDLMMSAGVGRSSLFKSFGILENAKFIERANGVIHLNSTLVWGNRRDAIKMARFSEQTVSPRRKNSA